MDYLETTTKNRAFVCLGFYLETKIEIPEIHKSKLEKAEDIFGEIIRGLESMTSELGVYPVEDLREIVEAMGHASLSYPREKIKKITAEFKETLRYFMELEENQQKIYEDERKRNRLLDACKRMSSFYSKKIPNHRVLEEE
jgi:hypothetical protein